MYYSDLLRQGERLSSECKDQHVDAHLLFVGLFVALIARKGRIS
jgi:hypothetical protein